MQGTIRKKEEELTGAIWDCLPVTEKSKDEINFAGLGEEVSSCSRVSVLRPPAIHCPKFKAEFRSMERSVDGMKLHTEKYSGDFILLNLPELFQGCEIAEKVTRFAPMLTPSTTQVRCAHHYTTPRHMYLLEAFLP
jgi:hypothetical protein